MTFMHANFIANKGRRGAGNFAVVSAKIASVLQVLQVSYLTQWLIQLTKLQVQSIH
jgi:hypothetical protein